MSFADLQVRLSLSDQVTAIVLFIINAYYIYLEIGIFCVMILEIHRGGNYEKFI